MTPESLFQGFIWILIIGIVIVVSILAGKQRKKRAEELRVLAQRLNLTLLEDGIPLGNSIDLFSLIGLSEPSAPSPYSAEFITFFPLFDVGSSRRIAPAMLGSDTKGNNWFLFEYRYSVSNGKSTTTYHFSVVVAQLPLLLPTMSLEPENIGYSVGKFFGMKELLVESEEFNRRYFIKTSDPKMTLDLLHPIAIEALLNQPNYSWQMAGPFVMLNVRGQVEAFQFEGMMGCVNEFINQIPTFYRQDHGAKQVNQ